MRATAHVSSDGKHLVILTVTAKLIIISDFEATIPNSNGTQDSLESHTVEVQLGSPTWGARYLAFEHGRIAAATVCIAVGMHQICVANCTGNRIPAYMLSIQHSDIHLPHPRPAMHHLIQLPFQPQSQGKQTLRLNNLYSYREPFLLARGSRALMCLRSRILVQQSPHRVFRLCLPFLDRHPHYSALLAFPGSTTQPCYLAFRAYK